MYSEEFYFEEKFIRCSLSVALVCIVLVLLMYFNFKTSKEICILCLLTLSLFDLYSNACKTFEKYSFIDHNNLSNFVKNNIDIVNTAKEIDPDFYRIEKTFARTRNDNMLLDIPGLSHYSSSEKDYIKHLMGALGYDQYGDVYCAYGKGSTVSADSLLGVRHLISTLDLEKERGYVPIKRINEKTIYKNPDALNIGTVLLEDFAESFAHFVASSKFEDERLQSKINFFNNNQNLLAVKNKILKNIEEHNIRLIAINDGVDSAMGEDDFTPFQNIMNGTQKT